METKKQYIPAGEVCSRFGVTQMTLWRWLKDDELGFPQPAMTIRKRRFFDLAEIEAFEDRQRAAHEAA